MKQSKEVIDSRRNKLLLILKEKKTLTVEELAQEVKVSLPTLRRDLAYLSDKGLINRYHGGANATDSRDLLSSRLKMKKDLIAKTAAGLIENDEIIFMNSAATGIRAIEYIEPSKYVSVITNNGKALQLHTLPNVKLIITGGETRQPKSAMTGEFALNNVKRVQANKLIMGASGFHIDEGITTANIDEVAINKAMIKGASEVILCVDSSKLNHVSAFISGAVEDVDILITDVEADPELIKEFKARGLKVILVDIDQDL